MDAALREHVRRRASDRCEYYRLEQKHAPFPTFHIEHIRARIDALDRMRAALERLTAACIGDGSVSECPILEAMEEANTEGEK